MGIELNKKPFIITHAKIGSLKDELSSALTEGFHCKVRYVHSSPTSCDPLFSPLPRAEPEKTRLASHFLTVSVNATPGSSNESTNGVLVLGIEALVYTTKSLNTIFVSKADSTGFLPQQKPSPIKAITTTFLRWLSTKERHKHPKRTLVISLFARAQSQYLFPGSAENSKKHVLDDRQLIKWWARVLDPILPKKAECKVSVEAQDSEYDGYITVPGYQGVEVRPFLPAYNHSSSVGQHWKPGDPLQELAETRGTSKDAPPRCLLPRFPDDPKARFIQDLDDEVGLADRTSATVSPSKRKSGKWSTIWDLDRFWEAMEFRQECSSGRVVGFLWVVIRTKRSVQMPLEREKQESTQDTSQGSLLEDPYSDPLSQPEEASVSSASPTKRRRKPLSGPIIPRQPRLKGGSSSLTATSDLNGMLNVDLGDGLVLSKDGYDKAMHTLLHLDFATLDAAIQSTNKWISEVSSICGIQADWSLEVTGTAKTEEMARDASSNGNPQVNDLGGMIKKKRKAEDWNSAASPVATDQKHEADENKLAVNVLGAGMIRKKPKVSTQ